MNDQSAKADAGKPDLTLVPTQIIYEIEKIRSYGTAKYKDRDNWKRVSIERYWQATLRHILKAWNNVEAVDEESGLLHISHAVCNIAFILELMKDGNDGMEKKLATGSRCDWCMYSDLSMSEEPCVKCLKLPTRNDFFRPNEFIRKVARTIADEKEDGCCGCVFEDCTEDEYPCTSCQKNYMNMYERSK